MNFDHPCLSCASETFEVHYPSLANAVRGFVFPCNANGEVDLNRLSRQARSNYFLVRALVGRDYGWPFVVRTLRVA